MEQISQSDKDQILQLVGAIVITSQTAEGLLKSFLPRLEINGSNSRSALNKSSTIKKRTLGDLAGIFTSALSGSSEDVKALTDELARVVDSRNQITHHFHQNFGKQLMAGNSSEVINSLLDTQSNIRAFCSAMERIHASVSGAASELQSANQSGVDQVAQIVIQFDHRAAS